MTSNNKTGHDKMEDDFCLSDEIIDNCVEADEYDNMIPSYKVKEFIKRLKKFSYWLVNDLEAINLRNEIDQLAGQKLIEGEKGK